MTIFTGSIPALITPFKNGEIDWTAFEDICEWHVEQGSHALVPVGTTGESPTLSHDEHNSLVERCVQVVNKRIPVIAGTGSNSTKEAIALTQHAKEAGADGALIVAPYYNKPTQDGLFAHFKAINDSVSLPIIVYNIPGRSVVDISNDTIVRMAKELPDVVGVKDATADLSRPPELRGRIGDAFCQLSGEDATTPGYLAQGGHGCISVVANIAPALSAEMHESWMNGDVKRFTEIRDLLAPLATGLFCESSPAPVKYAARVLGLCDEELRLPLLKATDRAHAIVDDAMAHAGLKADNILKVHG